MTSYRKFIKLMHLWFKIFSTCDLSHENCHRLKPNSPQREIKKDNNIDLKLDLIIVP